MREAAAAEFVALGPHFVKLVKARVSRLSSERERGPNALTVAQVHCCVEQPLPLLARYPQIRVHVPGDEHGDRLI